MYLKLNPQGQPDHNLPPTKGPRPLRVPGQIPRPGGPLKGPQYGRPPIHRPRPNPVPQRLPRRKFGKWVKLGGGMTAAGLAWSFTDYFDGYQFYKKGDPFRVEGGGWYLKQDCGRRPGSPPYGPSFNDPNDGPWSEWYSAHANNCLAGQVPSNHKWRLTPYVVNTVATNTGDGTVFISDSALTPALRMRHDVVYWRDDASTDDSPTSMFYRPTWFYPGDPFPDAPPPDPNRPRPLPADPPHSPDPIPDPSGPDPEPGYFDTAGPPLPPPPPHTRQPPPPGMREKKELSRARRVGIFLWRMLDTVSELSEIARAFYDALPAEVRERAGCGSPSNIGQYGSSVNSCMLNALYDNLGQLDTGQAFLNIAKNIVEDMTIGQFHRWLARVTPREAGLTRTLSTHAIAQMGMEAYVAKRLKELFAYLGL